MTAGYVLVAYLTLLALAVGLALYGVKLHREDQEWRPLADHRDTMRALHPGGRR